MEMTEASLWFAFALFWIGCGCGFAIGFMSSSDKARRAFHKGKAEGWFEASEFMGPPLDVRKVYQRSLSELRRVK